MPSSDFVNHIAADPQFPASGRQPLRISRASVPKMEIMATYHMGRAQLTNHIVVQKRLPWHVHGLFGEVVEHHPVHAKQAAKDILPVLPGVDERNRLPCHQCVRMQIKGHDRRLESQPVCHRAAAL